MKIKHIIILILLFASCKEKKTKHKMDYTWISVNDSVTKITYSNGTIMYDTVRYVPTIFYYTPDQKLSYSTVEKELDTIISLLREQNELIKKLK